MTMDDVTLNSLHPIKSDNGYVLSLYTSPESFGYHKIKEVEEFAVQQVINNYRKWFNTDVSISKIREYFCPTINTYNICTVHTSIFKPPTVIVDGDKRDEIAEICCDSRLLRKLKTVKCSCTVDITGLYFYPKKFGLKLSLRKIHFIQNVHNPHDDVGAVSIDKRQIEDEWATELEEFRVVIEDDKRCIQEKMAKLDRLYENARDMYTHAVGESQCTDAWNTNLESLRSLIVRYKTGCLS